MMFGRNNLMPADRSKCILVADDERNNRLLLGRRLQWLGFPCQLYAVDGTEALSVYQSHRDNISVVITDYKMPNMDGASLFWSLKKLNPEAKVILCTGLPDWTVIDPMLGSGLKAVLVKPFEEEKLASALVAAFN